jgi:ABC-2 type transport system ATP-binding protein
VAAQADPAVVLKGIRVLYGPHAALDGLDLEIPGTGTFGLLGRNGAGKTTTIRAMAGLVRTDRGSIRVLGRDPAADPSVRRDISVLFSEDGLLPALTTQENLTAWGMVCGLGRGESSRLAVAMLSRPGLDVPAGAKVRDLSTGNRRMAALARAFMIPGRIVILDEPTASLDPVRAVEARRAVRDMSRDRLVVLSTHNLEEAEALCDSVAIIHLGRSVAAGLTHSLLQDPVRAYSARTETGIMFFEGAAVEAAQDGSFVIRSDRSPADLLADLVDSGNRVTEFKTLRRTLAEVFLDLAGGDT